MKQPCISIQRSNKKVAIFDGFDCVRGFDDYTDEEHALSEAKSWIAERTTIEPEIVYPNITRMTVSKSRRKK